MVSKITGKKRMKYVTLVFYNVRKSITKKTKTVTSLYVNTSAVSVGSSVGRPWHIQDTCTGMGSHRCEDARVPRMRTCC